MAATAANADELLAEFRGRLEAARAVHIPGTPTLSRADLQLVPPPANANPEAEDTTDA